MRKIVGSWAQGQHHNHSEIDQLHTSANPLDITSKERNVRVCSSFTKTSHLLKSNKYLFLQNKTERSTLSICAEHWTQICKNYRFRKIWSDRFWECSFPRSMSTIVWICCAPIETVLPKLIWNSLPKPICSSFWSSLQRTCSGMSTSTTWRSGKANASLFKNWAKFFFGADGKWTERHKRVMKKRKLAKLEVKKIHST